MFSNALNNLREINRLTDKGQIAQQVQNELGTEGMTEEHLKEQAKKNYKYLEGKYGEWEIYGQKSSMINIHIIDYRKALFGEVIKAYLILTIISFFLAIIIGKFLLPMLSKMYTNNNEQMVDLATLQTQETVQAIKTEKTGGWF